MAAASRVVADRSPAGVLDRSPATPADLVASLAGSGLRALLVTTVLWGRVGARPADLRIMRS